MGNIRNTEIAMRTALNKYVFKINKVLVTDVMNGSFVLVVRGLNLNDEFFCIIDEGTYMRMKEEHKGKGLVPEAVVAPALKQFCGIPIEEDREEFVRQLLRNHLEE